MNDVIGQIQTYIDALWRKKWYVVPIAWVLCFAGWMSVKALPDRFESQTRIYVDTDSMLAPLLRGISIEGNIGQQVDFMQRTLLSRPNVEKLIRMADLDLQITNQLEKDELVKDLVKRITIQAQGQGRNLFTVSATDRKPETAQRMVQSLLSIFVESNIGASRTDLEKARQFLDVQIAEYERQLQATELKIANFRNSNMAVLAQAGGAAGSVGFSQRLDTVRQQRIEAKGLLEDLTSKRDALRRELANIPPVIQIESPPQVVMTGPTGDRRGSANLNSLEARIQETEKGLDSLLLRYTESHPDVKSTRRTLDMLRNQYDTEKKNLPPEAAAQLTSRKQTVPNAVYEQIKLRLVERESEVESAERRTRTLEDEQRRLESLASVAPGVETEFANLSRDYGVLKKNYEELTARRESAKIADAVETKGEKIQFRIVDPPQVPSLPSGPPRLLLMSAVLVASLAAGFAVAFLMSQLDDSFLSVNRLRQSVAVPILGSVSRVLTSADRRRRIAGTVGFAMSMIALIVVYGYLAAQVLQLPIAAT